MNSWDQLPYMYSDDLSIEVNGINPYTDLNPTNSVFDDLFSLAFDNDSALIENTLAGTCDEEDLRESIAPRIEFNDLATNFGPTVISSYEIQNPDWLTNGFASDQFFDNDLNFSVTDGLPKTINSQNHKVASKKESTPLFTVADTRTPLEVAESSGKIEILHDLEKKFRPRYKTDYFALNGLIRKPRYVTDCGGNHYIPLRVPIGTRGVIRVDWVTLPDANNQRYSMPYKFQEDNKSQEVPDMNPIYRDIEADSYGIMKLYLVLIKAKQDALKSLQPLEPFRPWKETFEVDNNSDLEKMPKLTAKQLINKYQLTKSQLAFTLCTTNQEDNYIPDWTTTVYSSILEESADNAPEKTVTCPKCSQEISVNETCLVDQDVSTNKRKTAKTKPRQLGPTKKQKCPEIITYTFE